MPEVQKFSASKDYLHRIFSQLWWRQRAASQFFSDESLQLFEKEFVCLMVEASFNDCWWKMGKDSWMSFTGTLSLLETVNLKISGKIFQAFDYFWKALEIKDWFPAIAHQPKIGYKITQHTKSSYLITCLSRCDHEISLISRLYARISHESPPPDSIIEFESIVPLFHNFPHCFLDRRLGDSIAEDKQINGVWFSMTHFEWN